MFINCSSSVRQDLSQPFNRGRGFSSPCCCRFSSQRSSQFSYLLKMQKSEIMQYIDWLISLSWELISKLEDRDPLLFWVSQNLSHHFRILVYCNVRCEYYPWNCPCNSRLIHVSKVHAVHGTTTWCNATLGDCTIDSWDDPLSVNCEATRDTMIPCTCTYSTWLWGQKRGKLLQCSDESLQCPFASGLSWSIVMKSGVKPKMGSRSYPNVDQKRKICA